MCFKDAFALPLTHSHSDYVTYHGDLIVFAYDHSCSSKIKFPLFFAILGFSCLLLEKWCENYVVMGTLRKPGFDIEFLARLVLPSS